VGLSLAASLLTLKQIRLQHLSSYIQPVHVLDRQCFCTAIRMLRCALARLLRDSRGRGASPLLPVSFLWLLLYYLFLLYYSSSQTETELVFFVQLKLYWCFVQLKLYW
jgi:hypothetical protein